MSSKDEKKVKEDQVCRTAAEDSINADNGTFLVTTVANCGFCHSSLAMVVHFSLLVSFSTFHSVYAIFFDHGIFCVFFRGKKTKDIIILS